MLRTPRSKLPRVALEAELMPPLVKIFFFHSAGCCLPVPLALFLLKVKTGRKGSHAQVAASLCVSCDFIGLFSGIDCGRISARRSRFRCRQCRRPGRRHGRRNRGRYGGMTGGGMGGMTGGGMSGGMGGMSGGMSGFGGTPGNSLGSTYGGPDPTTTGGPRNTTCASRATTDARSPSPLAPFAAVHHAPAPPDIAARSNRRRVGII
jgi:hypothetical protein